MWLLAVEAALAASLVAGVVLVRALFRRSELARLSASFLEERDFATRLKRTGQDDFDALIDVYNEMAAHLMQERVRMQEQQQFLERLLEASPSGIVTFDYDGRISLATPSAARMLGAARASLAGRRLPELDTPFARALAEVAPGTSRVIALQGSRRIRVQASEFLDRGFPRVFLLLEELTEELRRSEKAAYEKLIRMLSHEVNNSLGASLSLLASCAGYASQLTPEDRADYTGAMAVVTSRLEELGRFMKDFAEVVRLPDPKREPSDLAALLRGIVTLMGADAARRRIALTLESTGEPHPVSLDRRQMEQVFVNVVKNALEAVREDGRVAIRATWRAAGAVVVVEDSGPGIVPEARDQLFRPFFSTKENGQGLGLTIVQEILTRHGFPLSLESAPGGPTRFTVVVG